MSTRPLLDSGRLGSNGRGGLLSSVSGIFSAGGIFGANTTAYDGVTLMLNAATEEERDDLTRRWRDHKIAELNFVGTLGALLAACLSSAGSWPDVLANERDKPWGVRVCLYGGLVFALFAVLVAGQQSMRLHRLSGHRDGLSHIRERLARVESSDGYKPYKFQVYAWGASLYFLVASVVCMIVSITVLVWMSAGNHPDEEQRDTWWDDNSKLAVTFTIMLGISILGFLASQSALAGSRPPRKL